MRNERTALRAAIIISRTSRAMAIVHTTLPNVLFARDARAAEEREKKIIDLTGARYNAANKRDSLLNWTN